MAQTTGSHSVGVHVDARANDQPPEAERIACDQEPSVPPEVISPAPAEASHTSQAEVDGGAASTGTSSGVIAAPLRTDKPLERTQRGAQSQLADEQALSIPNRIGTTASVAARGTAEAATVLRRQLATPPAMAERVLTPQARGATPTAPPVTTEAPETSPSEPDDFLRTVVADIHDKQYRLYAWNDAKTQALVTTNAALFAAVGFLFPQCLNDRLAMVLLGMGAAFLSASLITCLVHVIPKISSGQTGNEPNIRSLRGIGLYPTWEDYSDALIKATKPSIRTDTIRSIYGMVRNNLRSFRIIRRGVRFTLAGVVAIVAAMVTSAFAARGYHAFGSWKVETPVAAGVTADVTQPKPTGAESGPVTPNPPVSAAAPAPATTALQKGATEVVRRRSSSSTVPKKQQ